MDFVDDILAEGEEVGLRIDSDFIYAPTACVVKAIHALNLSYILKSVGVGLRI